MNLKQLSEVLGLSQTTVSRALNGYPEVSNATRLRVIAAAEKHNYTPNARAKSLATGRAGAIGHVFTSSGSTDIMNPIFGDFIAGAGKEYSKAGIDMIISVVPDGEEVEAYRELKEKGNVDGVVIHGPKTNDERIPLLKELGLPFAVHGRASGIQEEYAWVDVNNRRSFERATNLLIDLGHRHIALLNGDETLEFAYRRRLGYEKAMTDRGLQLRPEFMTQSVMTEAEGHRLATRLLEDDTPPTAFIVSTIMMGYGVRRALWEQGLVMGRDVSVITHDDALSYLSDESSVPTFTATISSVRKAGCMLAQILIDQIQNPGTPPRQILLEADLTLGASTGPAPTT